MSSKEILGAQDEARATGTDHMAHDRETGDNTVAQKLSHELDNWRRQRNGSKPMRCVSCNRANRPASCY